MKLVQLKTAAAQWCIGALGLMCMSGAQARFSYHVQVDTSSLGSNPDAPFSLDFQLIDGGGLVGNTVLLGNFTFGGGSATGSPSATGGATGDLNVGVQLSDSLFFNELFQSFMPGSTLGFDVSMTENPEPGTPDAFSFAILDKDLLNIPTTGLGDSLLFVNLNSPLSIGNVVVASGTGAFGKVATVASIPDSGSTCTYLLLGLGGIGLVRRRFRL